MTRGEYNQHRGMATGVGAVVGGVIGMILKTAVFHADINSFHNELACAVIGAAIGWNALGLFGPVEIDEEPKVRERTDPEARLAVRQATEMMTSTPAPRRTAAVDPDPLEELELLAQELLTVQSMGRIQGKLHLNRKRFEALMMDETAQLQLQRMGVKKKVLRGYGELLEAQRTMQEVIDNKPKPIQQPQVVIIREAVEPSMEALQRWLLASGGGDD